MSVKRGIVEEIEQIANKGFKHHEILSRVEAGEVRSFRVGKPNCGIYAFRVTFVPGYIHLYGDTGNVTYCPYREDSFRWAQSSRENLDYITGKIEPHSEGKEFYESKAREGLKWFAENDDDFTQEILDEALSRADNEIYLQTYICEEIPDGWEIAGNIGIGYSRKAIWSHFALKKFFELLESETVEAESAA
jgi:hypothetical protein